MNLALRKDVGGCQPLKVANYSHSFLIAIYYGLVYFLNDKTPNIHIADTMTLSLVGAGGGVQRPSEEWRGSKLQGCSELISGKNLLIDNIVII